MRKDKFILKGVMCLFKHEKMLFHPVEVERANPHMVRRYTFPGADHGISYLVDEDLYRRTVAEFVQKVLK